MSPSRDRAEKSWKFSILSGLLADIIAHVVCGIQAVYIIYFGVLYRGLNDFLDGSMSRDRVKINMYYLCAICD